MAVRSAGPTSRRCPPRRPGSGRRPARAAAPARRGPRVRPRRSPGDDAVGVDAEHAGPSRSYHCPGRLKHLLRTSPTYPVARSDGEPGATALRARVPCRRSAEHLPGTEGAGARRGAPIADRRWAGGSVCGTGRGGGRPRPRRAAGVLGARRGRRCLGRWTGSSAGSPQPHAARQDARHGRQRGIPGPGAAADASSRRRRSAWAATSGTPRRSPSTASSRSPSPTARTACAASPRAATTSGSAAASRPPASRPACALASSWNPELAREIGDALGVEARAQDVAVVLGPGLNIKRSPLCGRNFEYLSEDPYLAGRMGAALVHGHPGARRRRLLKHFAANNQETDRMRVSADVDERTLREIYLPAFEHIVTDGRPVDRDVRLQQDQRDVRVGAPLAAHRAAARRVGLRRAGHVRLGGGARPGRRGGRRARPGDAAGPRATATRRWSRPCRRAGWTKACSTWPRPGCCSWWTGPPAAHRAEIDVDAHHALARRAAAECIVLLRNDGGVLPLAGTRHRRGARRARPHPPLPGRRQLAGEPDPGRRPLDALTAALPGATVRFAAGYPLDDPDRGPGRTS